MYQFAKPADGYAYNANELRAILHITVDGLKDVLEGPLSKRWEVFVRWADKPPGTNPYRNIDTWSRDLLTRALLAEVEDPEPDNMGLEPPPYNWLITKTEEDGA